MSNADNKTPSSDPTALRGGVVRAAERRTPRAAAPATLRRDRAPLSPRRRRPLAPLLRLRRGRSVRRLRDACAAAGTRAAPCSTRTLVTRAVALSADSGCAMQRTMRLAASLPVPPDPRHVPPRRRACRGARLRERVDRRHGRGPDAFVVAAPRSPP